MKESIRDLRFLVMAASIAAGILTCTTVRTVRESPALRIENQLADAITLTINAEPSHSVPPEGSARLSLPDRVDTIEIGTRDMTITASNPLRDHVDDLTIKLSRIPQ